jgi:bifunctional UDP-N-acetylglucosamine pyrophosphorylase/glucosamine-1-phosphate N-acetyltransferase
MSSSLTAVVLAAGLGTRMKSKRPKVLHAVAGRPLIYYPLRAAFDAGAERAVVVTSGQPEIGAELGAAFGTERIETVLQDPPRGTGDAARIGLARVSSERVLILYGDTPLVQREELSELLNGAAGAELAVLGAELAEPFGYGRILRGPDGGVVEIREERDLRSDAERSVREVNAGMYAGRTETVRRALLEIQPNNAQGEYYLTDVVALIAKLGRVEAVRGPAEALLGVNDRAELRKAEELMFERIRRRHGKSGVSIHGDPRIDDAVTIGEDAIIEAGVVLRGRTEIGAGALIGVGSVVTDCRVGPGAALKPYTVMSASSVGESAQIGPFSHLRPDSEIEPEAHIGNFVETKKTRVRRGAKANHLAYLGYQKQRTVIEEGAFIGSDSQLVAPVTIGKGAYVATGTTVTQDVPENALAIGRARQENKLGYAPRLKGRLAAAAKNAKKT